MTFEKEVMMTMTNNEEILKSIPGPPPGMKDLENYMQDGHWEADGRYCLGSMDIANLKADIARGQKIRKAVLAAVSVSAILAMAVMLCVFK